MANEDQVALLKRGTAAWNAWRAEHPDAVPDLSGAALRGLDLAGAHLAGALLPGADLRGTVLRGADLAGAKLDGANLFKAVLEAADLSGADLRAVRFLHCAQLVTARNWESAGRDADLACGAPVPGGGGQEAEP
ncbi:MAG: pentapeptide repeat-containing protein [Kiloniellaceae bacterium]